MNQLHLGGHADDVPVAIFDRSGGVWAFADCRQAANWIEAIDVVDGEYHGYDAEGRVLSFSVDRDVVSVRPTRERAYEEAVDHIRSAMAASPVRLTAESLEGMIAELLKPPPHRIRHRISGVVRILRGGPSP